MEVLNIDWNKTFEGYDLDPNLCFDVVDSKMKNLIDRHLPKVKLTKRQIKTKLKTKLKTWITRGILKSSTKTRFLLS